jgi:hypothetical protein
MNLRLHAFEQASRSNGPALRAVIWSDFTSIPGCEVILHTNGSLTVTGIMLIGNK